MIHQFIDYTTSRPIHAGGHEAHLQAYASQDGVTLLLVLQGRATHVRAMWAAFHEKSLVTRDGFYFKRDDGKVYVSPNPTLNLPSGIQMWVIHHDLTTTLCDHAKDHFYTFGPPHFGAMMAATTAVPMLPRWEATLFQLGRRLNLVNTVSDNYNTRLYTASRDAKLWLEMMKAHRKELHRG
jgi:hypothetical protein